MSDKNKYSLQSDASLGSIVQGLENAFKLAKQNWRLLVICPVILALLGLLAGWFLNDNVKKAEFIIAAEEEGPSGMENLLANLDWMLVVQIRGECLKARVWLNCFKFVRW